MNKKIINTKIKILKDTIQWFKKQIKPEDCGWMYTTIDGIKYKINFLKKELKNLWALKKIDIHKPSRMFWSALFSVRKEAILSNSKEYYKTLIKDLDHIHPIHAYYFESSWSYVFNEIDNHNLIDLDHNNVK